MVRVCDAIMGSGKTSATIRYFNEHPEKRFLYVTPYKEEAVRIRDSCPECGFVVATKEELERLSKEGKLKKPARKRGRPKKSETGEKKDDKKAKMSVSLYCTEQIEADRNVATTHQALTFFMPETVDMLKEKGYTVVIDEQVCVLSQDNDIASGDIQVLLDGGVIEEESPNKYRLTGKDYTGKVFQYPYRIMQSRPLLYLHDDIEKNKLLGSPWYWVFPVDIFKKVEDVVVLTYMFRGSEMEAFFKINGIEWEPIGISCCKGEYRFSTTEFYIPEYVKQLPKLIHVSEYEKLNEIGDDKCALSKSWYDTHDEDVKQLSNHIWNYFMNRTECKAGDRMCGKFKGKWARIRKNGFYHSDVMFNERATNKYRARTVLVYPVNVFYNVCLKRYYRENGFELSDDQFALSNMVQWVWRSAIRDGKEIFLYVPSRRMRTLFKEWLKEVSS